MLIDTHAHLNDPRLLPEAGAIASALAEDGLQAVVNVGYDLESSRTAAALAAQYKGFYAAVGVHPHNAKDAANAVYDAVIQLAKEEKTVAYGEIGLDFHYDLSERDTQKRVFAEQLALADSLNLPVIIHLREAYEEMYRILKDNRHYLKNGILLHCYMGSAEYYKEICKLTPAYAAFGGAVTFQNAKKEGIVKAVPAEFLLLETDCPYMTPHPHRGKLNYPKYLNLVCQKLAEWLPNIDVAAVTTQNAKTFFRKLS